VDLVVKYPQHLGNLEDPYYLGVLVAMNLQHLGNLERQSVLVHLEEMLLVDQSDPLVLEGQLDLVVKHLVDQLGRLDLEGR
jgi:uncharacterized protein YjbK